MAYEVLTAFFLEAGFLGIMLFGREKVGPGLHMFACLMVAVGTAISATWILSVNSWMQTPEGFSVGENGQFLPEDWWAIVLNPSFPYRLAHTLTAAYLGTGLFAAFPLAYAIIMPAVYPPIIAMLLALIFRGVAFEFRWRAGRTFSRHFWDFGFIGG